MMMSPFSAMSAALPTTWIAGSNTATPTSVQSTNLQTNNPVVQATSALSLEPATQGLNAMSFPNAVSNWFSPFSNWINQAGQTVSNLSQSLGQMTSAFSLNLPSFGTSIGSTLMPSSLNNNQSINSIIMPTPTAISQAPKMSPLNAIGTGARQAIQDIGTLAKDNTPALLTFGGMMMCSTAVCSFMGGTLAATGAVMMGHQMLSNHLTQSQ